MGSATKGIQKCATCDFFVGANRTIKSSGKVAEFESNGYGNCQVNGKDERRQVNGRCNKYKLWRMMN